MNLLTVDICLGLAVRLDAALFNDVLIRSSVTSAACNRKVRTRVNVKQTACIPVPFGEP